MQTQKLKTLTRGRNRPPGYPEKGEKNEPGEQGPIQFLSIRSSRGGPGLQLRSCYH